VARSAAYLEAKENLVSVTTITTYSVSTNTGCWRLQRTGNL